jgi:tetrahydromethanopterin S-methyltransferase subunit G
MTEKENTPKDDDPIISSFSSVQVKIARLEERLNAYAKDIEEIKNRLNALEGKVWYIATGILVTIALQILILLLRLIF